MLSTRQLYCFALLPLLLCGNASAQGTSGGLFGDRTLGGGVSNRSENFRGSPGNQVEQAQSGAGEIGGDERFLRANRNPGDFVGADSSDTSNFFGNEEGLNQLSDLLGGRQASGRDRGREGSSNNTRDFPVRLRLHVGFPYRPPLQSKVATQLQGRLARVDTTDRFGAIDVEVIDRSAILRGAVATPHEAALAERLALLEPGVSAVQNELTVMGP